MNELLKFAQENNLTSEDLEYLFEQGLEKMLRTMRRKSSRRI